MKVLTINHNDKNGGAARAAIRIVNALEKNYDNIENTILVKHKNTNYKNIVESSIYNKTGVVKLLDDIFWKTKNRIRKYRWQKYTIDKEAYLSDLFSINLNNALKAIEYDILHLHWINEQFFDIRLLKQISKPIVWTIHDCWSFTGICHYFYDCENFKTNCGKCPSLNSSIELDISRQIWNKKSKVYKDCNIQVASPSNWLANAAKESSLFKNFNIKVIPNCIDTEIYRPINKRNIREILGLSPEKKYILFGAVNATSDRRKGYNFIRKTFEILLEKNKMDIELLILGSAETKNSKLFGFNSRHLGHLFDDYSLVAFYNAADVTIVPSLSENLSNMIMESLSCGTPAVAFDVGGNSDMIKHKKNGYLVKPFDTSEFAQGIDWCINNDDLLSEQARLHVLNNYTYDKIAKMYFDLYNSIKP